MAYRDMDRWLGDGGMELVGRLGASLERYGVDGEDLGWVEGRFEPTALAANPHGAVQAGVHAVVHDALMNFAINAALREGDRTQGTIEMTTELLRPAVVGGTYALRGDVVRLARQVAHAEAVVTEPSGEVVSRASGTFLLARRG
ncbi:MAG TPA: PaaI family thioesterase [Acidimicrobiales bacterium]|nr:PaaI family thioesterase [Acidimicrobiales bacterium]